MTNLASRWEPQVHAEPARALRLAGEQERRFAELRAAARAAGERWPGGHPAELAGLLCAVADDDPALAQLARASAQLLQDFVHGLGVAATEDLAADLIDGRCVPDVILSRLADAYVVVVARQRDDRPLELGCDGVLTTRRSGALVLLVPADAPQSLDRVTKQLVDGDGWAGTAPGPVTGLTDAHAEAVDVLRLVAAGHRPAGAYTTTDVLVAQAIVANPAVAARLAGIIRPVRQNQVLWETLLALVHADFNRNQASRDLFVHRSTLEYRLQRIAKITGWDPACGNGAQQLGAALLAAAVCDAQPGNRPVSIAAASSTRDR